MPGSVSSSASEEAELATLNDRVIEQEHEIAVLRQTLALRQSNRESTYRSIFDSINEAILIQDLDTGKVIDANQAALSVWGYRRDELLGLTFTELCADPDAQDCTPSGAIWQSVLAGEEYRCEWQSLGSGGVRLHLELTLKRVYLTGHARVIAIVRDMRERMQERLIQAQAMQLAELSTPLIPVTDRVVVMPLIGTVDNRRAQQIQIALLEGVTRTHAHTAILDLTGVSTLDRESAAGILRAAHAVRLLGARVMLTGISPEIAQALIELEVDLSGIEVQATLQAGIAAAIAYQPAARSVRKR